MKHKTPEQMPGILARLDDPYGIVWRAASIARRFSINRAMRFWAAMATGARHQRPIFILGMPRSGTTFLARVLQASSELGSLPWEGHDIWRMYHHPRYSEWESDFVGPGSIKPGERRFVNAYLEAHARGRRLVEKTADNLVRIPYLQELFPDAMFVVVKRNPCDVINSYINAWRHPQGRFRSYVVPIDLSIPGYPSRRQWCLTLIRGWRDFASAPVHEIAFAQWSQYVDAIIRGRSLVAPSQWHELHFEDLICAPDATFDRLLATLAIGDEPKLRARFHALLKNPVNALSPATDNKWRSENPDEIVALLPRIAASSGAIGYRIDEASGEVERCCR